MLGQFDASLIVILKMPYWKTPDLNALAHSCHSPVAPLLSVPYCSNSQQYLYAVSESYQWLLRKPIRPRDLKGLLPDHGFGTSFQLIFGEIGSN